jgi:hypothetical protein
LGQIFYLKFKASQMGEIDHSQFLIIYVSMYSDFMINANS